MKSMSEGYDVVTPNNLGDLRKNPEGAELTQSVSDVDNDTFEYLNNTNTLTIKLNDGKQIKIEANGETSSHKIKDLEGILSPLLDAMKDAHQEKQGGGIIFLHKFINRLVEAGVNVTGLDSEPAISLGGTNYRFYFRKHLAFE